MSMELPSSLVLAYLGDAVYELLVRRYLVKEKGLAKVNWLHKAAVDFVKAEAQSRFLRGLDPLLTEEEKAIVRRGRNTSSQPPRHVDVVAYRHATALECLFGYLHLKGEEERIEELFREIVRLAEEDL
ncbi:ribonuclease-3 family protein [Carboxydocella sp. ULO1]|nr:ribonuclease-3 family protein [Carboxydocella sp. ULO1]